MKADKEKLNSKGWSLGSAEDFLNLTPREIEYIEMKMALSRSLREQRSSSKLSQVEVARMIKTSQSRVAKMEAGDPTVSIDLLIKSLLALGVSRKDLAKTISSR